MKVDPEGSSKSHRVPGRCTAWTGVAVKPVYCQYEVHRSLLRDALDREPVESMHLHFCVHGIFASWPVDPAELVTDEYVSPQSVMK